MKIFEFKKILPQIPNILFRRRIHFNFEMLPFEAKDLSFRKRLNFFIAGLNQFVLPSRPLGFPVIAQVEPANFCNLSCPFCLTTSKNDSRPSACLSFNTFKKFIDHAGDYLLLIVLWNWGEPFLNPDIFKIISYAKSKGILIHSSTNGNVRFSPQKAESLVASGIDSLIVAVDGTTQETYGKFRKGGNLDRVLENIRLIVQAKKQMGSSTPRLTMRIVVTQDNEKELPLMRQLAEKLGVDCLTVKTVSMNREDDGRLNRAYAPEDRNYRMYEYEEDSFRKKERPFVCMRPWKRITLDALGEVISCEYDYKNRHSFGNLNDEGHTIDVWKSQRSKDFRMKFNKGHNNFYHCRDCVYKNRVADDCTVERII